MARSSLHLWLLLALLASFSYGEIALAQSKGERDTRTAAKRSPAKKRASKGSQETEKTSQSAQKTKKTSQSVQKTEKTSQSAQKTEKTSQSAQKTEKTSQSAQKTKKRRLPAKRRVSRSKRAGSPKDKRGAVKRASRSADKRSAIVFDPDWETSPSHRYGSLTPAACYAQLDQRSITYTKVQKARGVSAPVRITDGVGGVIYRVALPRDKRLQSPWEVFDCRLVLALHDFSTILQAHRIGEVIIYSSWRPPHDKWPEDKQAIRHPGALAVDIARMRQTADKDEALPDKERRGAPKEDEWLDVTRDWHGSIGSLTCHPKASRGSTAKARELRAIICEAAERRLFTTILTPNYDQAHNNHFHLDVHPSAKWRLIR